MTRRISLIVSILLLVVPAEIASAAAVRTFVSSDGLDSNPCSRTAPCRSFAAALAQTAANGVILALDSAGYGPVTIGQSITIVAADGVYAGVAAPLGGNGVLISGTSATDVITLRGLSIEGAGTGFDGVKAFGFNLAALNIDRCVITDFTRDGIVFDDPGVSGTYLFITDTTIRGCATFGIEVSANPGVLTHVGIDHVRAIENQTAMTFTQVRATVSNSIIAGNAANGIQVNFLTNGAAMIDGCEIYGNGTGILATNTATVRVANTTITDNTVGLDNSAASQTPASILTRIGDATSQVKTNTLEGNVTQGAFTGTYTAH